MAVSVVSGWESGLGPVVSSYLLESYWICFRTSFSSLGINPHCRIAHLVEIKESAIRHAKRQMGFSPLSWWDTSCLLLIVPIYHGLKQADTFCSSHIFCYQCLAGSWEHMPNCRQFFLKCIIKALFCLKKMLLSCCILCLRRSKSMYFCVALIGVKFHIPVVLRVNVLFPHILSILHPIWMGKSLLPFSMY